MAFVHTRRYSVLLCALLFFSRILFSQTVFDEDGKLTSLAVNGNTITDVSNNLLKAESDKLKKDARDLLVKKIEETIKIYESNFYKRSVHELYEILWPGQSDGIMADLRKLVVALKDPTAAKLNALSSELKTAISKHLIDAGDPVFYSKPTATKLNFWKREPFNGFVVDYYNATIGQIPNDITLETKIAETNYLKLLQERVTDILKEAKKLQQFDEVLYKKMAATDVIFSTPLDPFKSVLSRFNKPWFKSWFWFRGGQVTLNPLDFTTADYIDNNPSFDAARAAIFNEYIDSVINRQIRYDSTGKTNEFIQKLKLKGTGQNVFNFREKQDSLTKLNESRRESLLTTEQLLNKVTIPAAGTFYNFSAITDIKLNLDEVALKSPLHTKEKKSIVLHNILTPATAGLIESNKDFNDKSAFQAGFDSTVGKLGELAALVGKLSPYSSIIDFFLPPTAIGNNAIAYPRTAGNSESDHGILPTPVTIDLEAIKINYYPNAKMQKIYLNIETVLRSKGIFVQNIFVKVFPAGKDMTLEQVTNSPAAVVLFKQLLNQYLNEIFIAKIHALQRDSVVALQLFQVYNQSTLPATEALEPTPNKTAMYYTKLLETKPSDDAVERTVEIYTVKEKENDTSKVTKFSYKVGKNYHFRLGAGVAYTLNSYDQTIVKQSNGQISVENNIRQYRFIAGIHYYFCDGLYMQDSKIKKWSERNSLFIGVGIPDPLGNLYFGLNHDIVPGLKLTAGVHVAKNNKYFVQNNVIVEETLRYQAAGPFVSLMIDPEGLINLLNVFKKQ